MSKRLQDFIHESVDYGLALLEKTKPPLIPIVMVWQNGEVEANAMMDPSGANSLAFCDRFIAELPADVAMYAIIRDDVVGLGGNRRNILVAEAEERGMENSVRFTHDFIPGGFLRRFRRVGLPKAMGAGKRRFA